MEYTSENLSVGQFALNGDHVITAWDERLEKLTGHKAEDMIGTTDQWRAFNPYPQPVLADFFIKEDFEGACARFGTHAVWLLEQSREWLAIGQCLDVKGQVQAVIARASSHPDGQGAVQTIYLIEQIAGWARASSDRFDGMKILAENVPAGVCLIQDKKNRFRQPDLLHHVRI